MGNLVHIVQQKLGTFIFEDTCRNIHCLQLRKDIRLQEHFYNLILFFRVHDAKISQFRETRLREKRTEYLNISFKAVVFHADIQNQFFQIRKIGRQNILYDFRRKISSERNSGREVCPRRRQFVPFIFKSFNLGIALSNGLRSACSIQEISCSS